MPAPESSAEDRLAALDAHICEHLFADERNRRELLSLFFLSVADRLGEARQALNEGDWRELTRLAHVIRGAAGHIGAGQLAAAATALEMAALAGDAPQAGRLLGQVSGQFGKLRDEAHAAERK